MGKLYLCRHHVRFADFTAIPGEVVEAELTETAEKRLLALGALEAVELDNAPDAPQGGPAGENTPGADDAAPEDSAETEEENTEEEDTEAAEALAAAAAKACAAEMPKRKRNQK